MADERVKSKTNGWRRRLSLIVFGLAIMVFAYSLVQLYGWHRHRAVDADFPDSNRVITEDTEAPVETKPRGVHEAPGNEPKKILLNPAGASGYIQKVGLNSQGAIAVPNNIHFGGWYVDSALPGDEGLSIIAGHVSGRYSDAIFKQLHLLNDGDVLQVEYGDGRLIDFEVVDYIVVPLEESSAVLFDEREDITAQLNLITCDGVFDGLRQTYDDRLIVVARAL